MQSQGQWAYCDHLLAWLVQAEANENHTGNTWKQQVKINIGPEKVSGMCPVLSALCNDVWFKICPKHFVIRKMYGCIALLVRTRCQGLGKKCIKNALRVLLKDLLQMCDERA